MKNIGYSPTKEQLIQLIKMLFECDADCMEISEKMYSIAAPLPDWGEYILRLETAECEPDIIHISIPVSYSHIYTKLTFYENGELKRVFPLDGKISGFWSEEEEKRLVWFSPRETTVSADDEHPAVEGLKINFFENSVSINGSEKYDFDENGFSVIMLSDYTICNPADCAACV